MNKEFFEGFEDKDFGYCWWDRVDAKSERGIKLRVDFLNHLINKLSK
jgi:hypothetical protein